MENHDHDLDDDERDFKQNLNGYIYQIKLLLLFLWRGLKSGKCNKFLLGTELSEAEKFDDAIFFYEKDGKIYVRYMQAKYRRFIDDKNNGLKFKDFESGSNNAPCNLKKYFISYRKIKQRPYQKELHDLILCTNIPFKELTIKKGANILNFDDVTDDDEIFNDMKKYQLQDIKTAPKIYKELMFCTNLNLLAKELIYCIFQNQELNLQNYWISAFFNVLFTDNVIEEREFYQLSPKIENPKNMIEIQKNEDIQEFKNYFIPNKNIRFEKRFIDFLRNQKGSVSATMKETADALIQHVTNNAVTNIENKTFDKLDIVLTKYETFFVFTNDFIEGNNNLSLNAIKFRQILMKACQKEIAKTLEHKCVYVNDALDGIKNYTTIFASSKKDEEIIAKALIDQILYQQQPLPDVFERKYSFLNNVFQLAGINTLQFTKDFVKDTTHQRFYKVFMTIYAKEKLKKTTMKSKPTLKSEQDLSKCVKQLKLLYNEITLPNHDKSIPKILKLDQTEKDKMEGLFEALNGSIFLATTERDKIGFIDPKICNPIAEKFYEQLQNEFSIEDLKELQNFKIEYVNYPPCFEELQEAKIDINDDIKTFHKKMFIVNTPNENNLMKEVADEMGENFNFLDAETITFDLFQKVLNWAKEKEDVLLHENDANTFLDGILTKISGVFLGKCNIQFLSKLKEHSVTYNDILNELIAFMGLPPFASNASTKILHLKTNETLLTAIKVCQTLNSFSYFEGKDSFIFNPLTSLIRMEKTEKYISNTFASTTNLLIIVEKEVKKKELQKFCKMLLPILNEQNKKVVIISNETSELISFFKTTGKLEKFIKSVPQEITFDDLTRESQNIIRKSTFINFQGKEILLDTFLNESESSEFLDSTTLQNIINGEKIIIGAPLQTFTEIESACYRPRQIRLIEIEDILFKDKNLPEKNLYAIEGKEYRTHLNLVNQRIIKAKTFIENGILDKEKVFIILEEFNSEDQFQQICHKQPNYCIHWLKMSGEKLIWFHSYIPPSSTTTLQDCFGYYISRKEEYVLESFFEKYIESNRAVIITDKAGMGKSTLLTSFSKVLKSGKQWIIRINLNQYTTVLEKILQISYRNTKKLILNFDNFDTDYGKLILSSLITPENHENKTLTFENRIFQHFFTNRGILYIFDGFDEINPDYGEMILNLVDALRINENNRIWIASRTNFKTILEEKFNTFAYDIKPFDRNDQEIYLKQYWINKYKEEKGVEMPNQDRLSLYVEEVVDKAYENIRDIIGIPLQTKMYAEVLQKKNNDVISDTWVSCFEYVEAEVEPKNLNISTKLNLTMLYEKFFKEKIGKYYLYEKGILERSKPDSKGLEKKEEEAEYFYHKIFGYLALIGHQSDEETLLTETEKRQINNWYKEFNDGRKKMGIIDNFKDSAINPLFNHYTYAEYFAACFLIEKLILSTNRIEVFKAADKIFEKDVFTECFLLKLKQVTDDKELDAELNKKNILNFVTQHGRCINVFLQKNDLRETFSNIDKSGKTILHYAIESNNINAVVYILLFFWNSIDNTDLFLRYLVTTVFQNLNIAVFNCNPDIKLIFNDMKKAVEHRVKFKENNVLPRIKWKLPVSSSKKFVTSVDHSMSYVLTKDALLEFLKIFSYKSILIVFNVLQNLSGGSLFLSSIDEFFNDVCARYDITDNEKLHIFEDIYTFSDSVDNRSRVMKAIADMTIKNNNDDLLESVVANAAFKIDNKFLYEWFAKACETNVFEIVKKLFEHLKKCSTVFEKHSLCIALSKKSKHKIIEFLYEANESSGNFKKEKSLFVAVKHGCDIKIMNYLTEKGADPNTEIKKGKPLWTTAVEKINDKIIKYFLSKFNNLVPQSMVEILRAYYVSYDVNLKFKGKTLLHRAIAEKNVALCKFLIKKGADTNLKDSNGKTVYECAVEKNLKSIVDLLPNPVSSNHDNESVSDDESVNSESEDSTILLEEMEQYFKQAENNNFHFLNKFEEYYNNYFTNFSNLFVKTDEAKYINRIKRQNGKTLLYYAVKNNNAEAVSWILSYRANINVKDNEGKTPIFYAIEKNNKALLQLMLKESWKAYDFGEIFNAEDYKEVEKNDCTILMELILHCRNHILNKETEKLKNELELIENNEDLNFIFSDEVINKWGFEPNFMEYSEIALYLLQKGIVVQTIEPIARYSKNKKLSNLLCFLIQIAEYILSKEFTAESIIEYYNYHFTNILNYFTKTDEDVANKIIANARFNFSERKIFVRKRFNAEDYKEVEKDDIGATLLHIAAIKDEAEIVKWLINDKNADPYSVTHNGRNVFQLAKKNNSKNVLSVLQQ